MKSSTSRGPKKKIVRVAEEYDLEGIGEELAKKWTDPNPEDRYSLSDLLEFFNRRVLRAAMEEAGIDVRPGEVEYSYQYLMDDDAMRANKEETQLRLKNSGVDVEKLLDDFVRSEQTILKYLRDVKELEFTTKQPNGDWRQADLEKVRKLERRFENVVDDIVKRLKTENDLPDDEFDLDASCVITNKKTGQSKEIKELL